MTNLAHNLTETATRYGDPEPAAPTAAAPDVPPLPADRWRGDPLGGIRWQLELYRLLLDPVFRGDGVPRGDGRPPPTDPIGEPA